MDTVYRTGIGASRYLFFCKAISLIVYLWLAPCGSLLATEIYKWTDANGQVHYSDRPRSGAVQLNTADQPLPENIIRGLTEYDHRQLKALEKQQAEKQRLREKQRHIEEKQQQLEARQDAEDARRCSHYSRLVDRYRTKLRVGCKIKQCRAYKQRIKEYRAAMDDYCV